MKDRKYGRKYRPSLNSSFIKMPKINTQHLYEIFILYILYKISYNKHITPTVNSVNYQVRYRSKISSLIQYQLIANKFIL